MNINTITIITITIMMTNIRLDDHAPVFIYGVEGEQIEEENDAYNDLRFEKWSTLVVLLIITTLGCSITFVARFSN